MCVPQFAEQLATPGSTFERVFGDAELRLAANKPDRAAHLAGRWAAKEAFIKAWSQCLYGKAPLLDPDGVDFAQIEIRADRWGRVAYVLHGEILELSGDPATSLSISHDGDYAIAVCQIRT